MTTTRAEGRRAYRDREVSTLPKESKGSCARPTCDRNYRVQNSNRFHICPPCFVVVQTVEWLLKTGVLSSGGKTPLEALGLVEPK